MFFLFPFITLSSAVEFLDISHFPDNIYQIECITMNFECLQYFYGVLDIFNKLVLCVPFLM